MDIIALLAYMLLYFLTTKYFVTNLKLVDLTIKIVLKLGMIYFMQGDLIFYDPRYSSGYTVLIPSNLMFMFIVIVFISIIVDLVKIVKKNVEKVTS